MNEENAKRLLYDVLDILDELAIPVCLGSGTLLGAIRENRFMPVDRDIDLWTLAEDFESREGDIAALMLARGMSVHRIGHRHAGYWSGRHYAIKFAKYGEHGDLVSFFELGPYRYCPSHGAQNPFCEVFDKEQMSNWRKFKFYGRCVHVPVEAEGVLDHLYRETWRIPHKVYNEPCEHPAYIPHFLQKQPIAYVPMCLDVIHPGHLTVLREARDLHAKAVMVGLLSEEAIMKYKAPPVLSWNDRAAIANGLKDVDQVVLQEDYATALLTHKPAYLVHGDDWKTGPQVASRQLCLEMLPHWGGELVEVCRPRDGLSSTYIKKQIHAQS
jgi:cytidyltransferase-like protein